MAEVVVVDRIVVAPTIEAEALQGQPIIVPEVSVEGGVTPPMILREIPAGLDSQVFHLLAQRWPPAKFTILPVQDSGRTVLADVKIVRKGRLLGKAREWPHVS